MIGLSSIMMVLISWKLSLIFFGLFFLFSLITLCIKGKYENLQEYIQQQSIDRLMRLQNMGFRENANFTNVSI
jgi:ABC-type multidrug transport system fused ATPase/permease subunit